MRQESENNTLFKTVTCTVYSSSTIERRVLWATQCSEWDETWRKRAQQRSPCDQPTDHLAAQAPLVHQFPPSPRACSVEQTFPYLLQSCSSLKMPLCRALQ